MKTEESQKIWKSLPSLNQNRVLLMLGEQAILLLDQSQKKGRSYEADFSK